MDIAYLAYRIWLLLEEYDIFLCIYKVQFNWDFMKHVSSQVINSALSYFW